MLLLFKAHINPLVHVSRPKVRVVIRCHTQWYSTQKYNDMQSHLKIIVGVRGEFDNSVNNTTNHMVV
jgi:predicted XRE-type DNA-binding protein